MTYFSSKKNKCICIGLCLLLAPMFAFASLNDTSSSKTPSEYVNAEANPPKTINEQLIEIRIIALSSNSDLPQEKQNLPTFVTTVTQNLSSAQIKKLQILCARYYWIRTSSTNKDRVDVLKFIFNFILERAAVINHLGRAYLRNEERAMILTLFKAFDPLVTEFPNLFPPATRDLSVTDETPTQEIVLMQFIRLANILVALLEPKNLAGIDYRTQNTLKFQAQKLLEWYQKIVAFYEGTIPSTMENMRGVDIQLALDHYVFLRTHLMRLVPDSVDPNELARIQQDQSLTPQAAMTAIWMRVHFYLLQDRNPDEPFRPSHALDGLNEITILDDTTQTRLAWMYLNHYFDSPEDQVEAMQLSANSICNHIGKIIQSIVNTRAGAANIPIELPVFQSLQIILDEFPYIFDSTIIGPANETRGDSLAVIMLNKYLQLAEILEAFLTKTYINQLAETNPDVNEVLDQICALFRNLSTEYQIVLLNENVPHNSSQLNRLLFEGFLYIQTTLEKLFFDETVPLSDVVSTIQRSTELTSYQHFLKTWIFIHSYLVQPNAKKYRQEALTLLLTNTLNVTENAIATIQTAQRRNTTAEFSEPPFRNLRMFFDVFSSYFPEINSLIDEFSNDTEPNNLGQLTRIHQIIARVLNHETVRAAYENNPTAVYAAAYRSLVQTHEELIRSVDPTTYRELSIRKLLNAEPSILEYIRAAAAVDLRHIRTTATTNHEAEAPADAIINFQTENFGELRRLLSNLCALYPEIIAPVNELIDTIGKHYLRRLNLLQQILVIIKNKLSADNPNEREQLRLIQISIYNCQAMHDSIVQLAHIQYAAINAEQPPAPQVPGLLSQVQNLAGRLAASAPPVLRLRRSPPASPTNSSGSTLTMDPLDNDEDILSRASERSSTSDDELVDLSEPPVNRTNPSIPQPILIQDGVILPLTHLGSDGGSANH